MPRAKQMSAGLSSRYLGSIAGSLVPLVLLGVLVGGLSWGGLRLWRSGRWLSEGLVRRVPDAAAVGVVLAGLYLVSALLGNWPGTNLALLLNTFVPIALAVWLLVLWSAAESWARVHLHGFTTSLDTLRRGRLGELAGRQFAGT